MIPQVCYNCHGAKLIDVKHTGEPSTYIGCPACKTHKSDVIGEGFVYADQSESDAVKRLAADILTKEAEDARARDLAKELGATYNGRWHRPNRTDLFTFTDFEYGGTLCVESLDDLPQRLLAVRAKFERARGDV